MLGPEYHLILVDGLVYQMKSFDEPEDASGKHTIDHKFKTYMIIFLKMILEGDWEFCFLSTQQTKASRKA